MTDAEKLIAYANEIKLSDMTLDKLIDSHRRLCDSNRNYSEQSVNAFEHAKQRGYEAGLKMAKTSVSIEKLRTMTLEEISTLLANHQL